MDNETIREKLKKVAALMNDAGATDGERETARHRLELMLEKYGLKLEDVISQSQPITRYCFTYEHDWQKKILIQLVAVICGSTKIIPYVARDKRAYRRKDKPLYFDLTTAQYTEAMHLYPQYCKAFQEQFNTLLSAFIQNNNLAVPSNEDPKPLTEKEMEELLKLMEMMKVIGSANISRNLTMLGSGK